MKYAHVKSKNLLAMNPRSSSLFPLDAIITYEDDDDYVVTFDMTSHKFKTQSEETNEVLCVEYRLKYANTKFECHYYPSGIVIESKLSPIRK